MRGRHIRISGMDNHSRTEPVEFPAGSLRILQITDPHLFASPEGTLLKVNTLDTDLSLFFSRDLQQETGEDLVEKQNAELGLMPVVTDETAVYGYVDENRHMVQKFLAGERPDETIDDGVAVTELLMAAYKSAEIGEAVTLADVDLDDFVPAVARGAWNPRAL